MSKLPTRESIDHDFAVVGEVLQVFAAVIWLKQQALDDGSVVLVGEIA